MKRALVALVAVLALGMTGCLAPPSPMPGAIFLNVQDVKNVGPTTGTRSGTACITSILGLITTGNAGQEAARQAGGITEVTAVDYTSRQVLFFWGRYCTVVYGT